MDCGKVNAIMLPLMIFTNGRLIFRIESSMASPCG